MKTRATTGFNRIAKDDCAVPDCPAKCRFPMWYQFVAFLGSVKHHEVLAFQNAGFQPGDL
jgi:hypothetical protein